VTASRTSLQPSDVVIVEATRSPIGKRGGGFAGTHPAELLGAIQRSVVERAGIDPAMVDQIIGGNVSQVGEQAFNIARTAWLQAGLPLSVAATTIDSQCGSAQQATSLAASLVGSGAVDIALACGVESMSRIPLGQNVKVGPGVPYPKSYFSFYEVTSQFEGAERIARKWGITRQDTDQFGLTSQQRAAVARAEGRFEREITPIDAAVVDKEGVPTGERRLVSQDEGIRESSLEKLATLKAVLEDGVHTAGSSSQVSDGAAAVLLMTAAHAAKLGLKPRARIVSHCLVGVDPVLMLTGPIDATPKALAKAGMTLDDIDTVEINEAFASVALAWIKEFNVDPAKVNPNGGAIALGHPTGSTGARLITSALHELERTDGTNALITMCCGGGLGTGTVIQRV
jgi:acetyl-CoA C-acetyltransferase